MTPGRSAAASFPGPRGTSRSKAAADSVEIREERAEKGGGRPRLRAALSHDKTAGDGHDGNHEGARRQKDGHLFGFGRFASKAVSQPPEVENRQRRHERDRTSPRHLV